jgi:phosphopantothenoylcysteine decarboxylase/phosphopantothenate--cysteine ligase
MKTRPKLIIGFAAETQELNDNALKKLKNKHCDWILANNVNFETGVMGSMETEIKLFSKKETKSFPKMSKIDFSEVLTKRICTEFE